MPLVHIRLVAPRPKSYPEDPQTLGEHIKKRRLELGLTQAEAARRLKVNPWTVLNWETGRSEPPIRSMPAILAFLGYDPFPPPETVAERLLQTRRKHGWSTDEAASQVGVDRTTWRDWERGQLVLFRKHRAKVAELLGLGSQFLFEQMRDRWNGKHRRGDVPKPTDTDSDRG